jgi:methylmalonyl-CoA mutase
MSDRPDDLPLAAEFPAATREQWLALVARVLKGVPFDMLTSQTADGIAIAPLYARAARSSPIAGRAPGAPWQVMTRIDHPDAAAANAQALEDLGGGATGLVLVGAGAVDAYGQGLMPDADMERVLDGVELDAGIAIEFDISSQTKDLSLALDALARRRGHAPDTLNIRFGFDPIGVSARNGEFPLPWPQFAERGTQITADFVARGFRHGVMAADGRIVHGAGGSEAQELAYVIAVAVAYLRAFEAGGIALDDARRTIFFRLAADADQFLTIAKFRALRKLWQRVEDSCRLAPERIFISAETAWRTMTRNDSAVNILRATIAAFAAGTGGADAITVLPFTTAHGLPDAFARRLARNTQLILLDEANVARLADPTAGSGWGEALTQELCVKAWALFQEIEAAGGAARALEKGLIQAKVKAARQARERAVATRADALIGTNIFPDLAEIPVAVLALPRASAPPAATAFEPLTQTRLAEPYEALRDASDRMLAATGARPRIFVANLGRPADFNARATFAKNFFEAGGIEALTNDGFETLDALVQAFKNAHAKLACLCGDDTAYAKEASVAARALRAAGLRRLYLVDGDAPQTGADIAIHAGCDALAILREAQKAAS